MRPTFLKVSALLLLTLVTVAPSHQPTRQIESQKGDELVQGPLGVRLRKLHLVRPDLIPYPVNFEVYA